jgi:hypothetical protein
MDLENAICDLEEEYDTQNAVKILQLVVHEGMLSAERLLELTFDSIPPPHHSLLPSTSVFPNVKMGDEEDAPTLLYVLCEKGYVGIVNRLLAYPSTIETLNSTLCEPTCTSNPLRATINGRGSFMDRMHCARRLLDVCPRYRDDYLLYFQETIVACNWRLVKFFVRWYVRSSEVSVVNKKLLFSLVSVMDSPCRAHRYMKHCFVSTQNDGTLGCPECAFLCISQLVRADRGMSAESVENIRPPDVGDEYSKSAEALVTRAKARLNEETWKTWYLHNQFLW